MAQKSYYGDEVEVTFDLDKCVKAGECVRGLPEVFDVKRRPWIMPNAAPAQAVTDVVSRCPSGALQYTWYDQPEAA